MGKTIPCVSCGAPVEIPEAWDAAKTAKCSKCSPIMRQHEQLKRAAGGKGFS